MELQTFYKDWHILSCIVEETNVHLYIQSDTSCSDCPSCQQPSSYVHSQYWRSLKDLPLLSFQVHLYVRSRRFFCRNAICSQRIFIERNSTLFVSYARRTNRLASFLKNLAFTLSAEAAGKISIQHGSPTSPDSFLYLIQKEVPPRVTEPTIIGIDDWAMKKGQRYGSIICDLQTRKPIALLMNRTVQELSTWLKQYPSIQIVTRDGSTEFARGVQEGNPDAIQVTDRWHLFHNLSKKVQQYLKQTFPRKIRVDIAKAGTRDPQVSVRHVPALTDGEKRKWQLIQHVQALYQSRWKKADIIRECSLDRKQLTSTYNVSNLSN